MSVGDILGILLRCVEMIGTYCAASAVTELFVSRGLETDSWSVARSCEDFVFLISFCSF